MAWPGVPFWNYGTEGPGGGGAVEDDEIACGSYGSNLCKWEGPLAVPLGSGYFLTVTEAGGDPVTVHVLSSGARYWPSSQTSFLVMIAAALNSHEDLDNEDYALELDDDDDGTGKVTISATIAFSISFPDEGLMTALGFEEDTDSATSHTAPRHCPLVWLPPRRRWDPPTPEGVDGIPMPTVSVLVAPSGDSYALAHGLRTESSIEFRYLPGFKMWRALEQVPGESWEEFFHATIRRGLPVRYHHDRLQNDQFNQWLVEARWAVMPMDDTRYYVGRVAGPDCATTYATGKDSRWHLGPMRVVANRAA